MTRYNSVISVLKAITCNLPPTTAQLFGLPIEHTERAHRLTRRGTEGHPSIETQVLVSDHKLVLCKSPILCGVREDEHVTSMDRLSTKHNVPRGFRGFNSDFSL